jgi:hypothetical protein
MIYIVLGMHKSGTTLVSEILHKSGIPMIADQDGDPSYDTGNKYERVSTADLNKDILNCWDIESFNVTRPAKLRMSHEQQKRMIEIIGECQLRGNDWGFKDPRMCLTYELWEPHLPEHKIIAVFRRSSQVWLHYRSFRNFFRARKVLEAWKTYNSRIIDILRTTQRDYLVLNYERLMSEEEEFERLKRFVGKEITDARKENAYQERSRTSIFVSVADLLGSLLGVTRASYYVDELESLRTR